MWQVAAAVGKDRAPVEGDDAALIEEFTKASRRVPSADRIG